MGKTNPTFRVLMIARPNLFSYPGGDTTQIRQTANSLRKRGHLVEINPTEIDYSQFDLIHFFNLIDPEDILVHIKNQDLYILWVRSSKVYTLEALLYLKLILCRH